LIVLFLIFPESPLSQPLSLEYYFYCIIYSASKLVQIILCERARRCWVQRNRISWTGNKVFNLTQ